MFENPMMQGALNFLGSATGLTGIFEVTNLVPMGLGTLIGIAIAFAILNLVSGMIKSAGAGGGNVQQLTEAAYMKQRVAAEQPRHTASEWDRIYRERDAFKSFEDKLQESDDWRKLEAEYDLEVEHSNLPEREQGGSGVSALEEDLGKVDDEYGRDAALLEAQLADEDFERERQGRGGW